VIPGTSGFYGNWVEDVRAGQFIILGDFVGRCLVRRCTCLCGAVSPMCDSAQKRRAIEALKARAPSQTVWRLWLIVYRTELKVSHCA